MKEIIIPNCNKSHVLNTLANFTRLDGRSFSEFRKLKIDFGKNWGCCHVALGKSRVLAQVSCEVLQPKPTRPNEGILHINVELSTMAASNFESGRQSDLSVHLNRLLEKCIKDSRAIDLESMCIKLNEKVWSLRVDVNILNHEGNLLDCASIAAISALAHFRRPDISSDGEKIVIHTYQQRDPIPTVVHHYPICVTYAVFNDGAIALADPTFIEEGVSESQVVFAINSFKEICSVHLGGNALASQNLIMECGSKAANRAIEVVKFLKEELEKDIIKRKNEENPFFEDCFQKIPSFEETNLEIDDFEIKKSSKKAVKRTKKQNKNAKSVFSCGESSAAILNKEGNDFESSDDSDDDDVKIIETKQAPIPEIEISDSANSEEECTVTLKSDMTE